jgi:hypothetical protein
MQMDEIALVFVFQIDSLVMFQIEPSAPIKYLLMSVGCISMDVLIFSSKFGFLDLNNFGCSYQPGIRAWWFVSLQCSNDFKA